MQSVPRIIYCFICKVSGVRAQGESTGIFFGNLALPDKAAPRYIALGSAEVRPALCPPLALRGAELN